MYSYLKNGLFWLLIASLFVPAIVSPSLLFPFITGKNFAFRILVDIGLIVATLIAARDSSYRPGKNWILIAYTSFIVVLTAADFLGVNSEKSIWSNFERMEGLVAHLHIFGYFLLLVLTIRTSKMWQTFLTWSLVPNLYIVSYAFVQWLGKLTTHGSGTRVDATLGNPAYLAMYALFYVAIGLILFVQAKKGSTLRFFAPIVSLLNIFVVLLTQTRGTYIGLIAGTYIGLVLIGIFGKDMSRVRNIAVGGAVGLCLFMLLIFGFKHSAFVEGNSVLSRITSISLSDTTTQSRLKIWQMSYEGFKEHPILGWGQENFMYVFAKYYQPSMYNQEAWFDRSHDVFFDWLIAGGLLGLLTYLSLFVTALYYLWVSEKKMKLGLFERVILTSLLIGYFIHNIFVFDNLSSYMLFAIVLAFIATIITGEEPVPLPQKKNTQVQAPALPENILTVASISIVCAGLVLTYMVNIRPIFVASDLINGLNKVTLATSGDQKLIALASSQYFGEKMDEEQLLESAFNDFTTASQGSALGRTEVREQLVQNTVRIYGSQDVSENTKQKWANFAYKQISTELSFDEDNVRTLDMAGTFLTQVGQVSLALPTLERAAQLSPNKQLILFDLAFGYTLNNDFDKALEVFKKAYDLDPSYDLAHARYVYALYRAGNNKAADSELAILVSKENIAQTVPDLQNQVTASKIDYLVHGLNEAIDTNNYGDISLYSEKLIEMNKDFKNQLPAYIKNRQAENKK